MTMQAAGVRPAWTSACPSRIDRFGSSSHVQQNGLLSHPQDLDAPLRRAAKRKINSYRQQYADNQSISFLPAILCTSTRNARRFFESSFSTGPPRDRGALQCHRTAIEKPPIGQPVPVQARGILPAVEEQSRPRGGKSGGMPQCTLLHAIPSFSPSSFHIISHSPSFTSA